MAFLQLGFEPDQLSVISVTLVTALICACIVIGHLLVKYRWMNDSVTALAIVSLVFCDFGGFLY